MRKVTLALVLLALGLAVPVGVLVGRALESAALEEARRHQSVAERTFDEMERELTRFLEAEEARPFGDYRASGDAAPLVSLAPTPPFVVGYFEVEPDGSLRSVGRVGAAPSSLEATLREAWHRARAVEAVRPNLAGLVAPGAGANEDTVGFAKRGVAYSLGEAVTGRGDRVLTDAASQVKLRALPAITDRRIEPRAVKKNAAHPSGEGDYDSSYDVLRQLNLATSRRKERRQKISLEPADRVYAAAAPSKTQSRARTALKAAAARDAIAKADSSPIRAAVPESKNELFSEEMEAERAAAAGSGMQRQGAASAALKDAAQRGRRADVEPVRVTLDPMVGAAAGGARLVLHRTVFVGDRAFRQGLVVDWRALGTWLEEQVIERGGLARIARASFHATAAGAPAGGQGREDPGPSDLLRFAHGFAEPFDAFRTELELSRLPGLRGTGPIYALTGLLVVVALAGLVAVHRMVAVVVRFAERRSHFAASVSHELKTPLTSIRMYAEMLRDGLVSNDAKRNEYYRTITDESERLSRLIDNVLEFSKLERGERKLDLTAGPIEPVVREAVSKLAPHAERLGFAIEVDFPREDEAPLPAVPIDPDALTQIVFNAIDNALKYAAGATHRTVRVEARAQSDGVLLSIRDFGPGVSQAEQAHIFEPFHRGDEEARNAKGSGIGLALVRELVESMGGQVEGANAEGGGFRLTIRFAGSSS